MWQNSKWYINIWAYSQISNCNNELHYSYLAVNHCTHLDFLGSTVNPWKIKWQMLGMSIDINNSIIARNSGTDIKCIHSNTISSPWISFHRQCFLLCHLTLFQVWTSKWCLSKVSSVGRLAIISLKLHCNHEETGWLYGSKWYILDQNSLCTQCACTKFYFHTKHQRLLSHLTWMRSACHIKGKRCYPSIYITDTSL